MVALIITYIWTHTIPNTLGCPAHSALTPGMQNVVIRMSGLGILYVGSWVHLCVAPIEVGCGTECLPSFFPPFFYFREQLNECRLTTQERTYPANMLFGKYRRYFYSRRGNSCQAAALQDKYGPLPWSHSLTCHHHYVRTTLLYSRRIFNWDLTEYNLNQRKSLAD